MNHKIIEDFERDFKYEKARADLFDIVHTFCSLTEVEAVKSIATYRKFMNQAIVNVQNTSLEDEEFPEDSD